MTYSDSEKICEDFRSYYNVQTFYSWEPWSMGMGNFSMVRRNGGSHDLDQWPVMLHSRSSETWVQSDAQKLVM